MSQKVPFIVAELGPAGGFFFRARKASPIAAGYQNGG